MNIRVVASVVLALMGFFSLFKSILPLQSLAAIPAMADHYQGSVPLMALGYAIPTVLLIAFGATLIARRDRLARWLVPDEDVADGAGSEEIAVLAFAILGLYLLITGLPWVVSLAMTVADYIIADDGGNLRRARIDAGRYLGYVAQFCFGVFLFVRAGAVAGWWRRRVATG